MSLAANFTEPTQDFPSTLASVQAYFATAASAQVWLFDAAGAVAEAVANAGNLAVTGTVHGALPCAAIQKNCASIRRGANDGYLAANATVLDAGAGSFSFFAWVMWDPDASGALAFVVDKLDGSGVGWQLKTDPTSYNITATVRDGIEAALNATTTTGTIFSGKSYQQGAWLPLMVSWNAATGVLKLFTNRETITSTNAAMAGLSNAVAATVGNSRAASNPLRGALAYALHMPGLVASQSQFDALVRYGTVKETNLARVTPSGDGCITLDNRDATIGTRVVLRDKTQPAFDQRYGNSGMLFENQTTNGLFETEEIGSTTTWTNDSGIALTRDYGVAPRQGSWSSTRLLKSAAGALKYTASSTYSIFTNLVVAGVWARANTTGSKITLRLTATTGTPTDQTQSFTLTSAWERYTLTATVNNEACGGKLFIAAGDASDASALADIEVWGASATVSLVGCGSVMGAQYYPCHLVQNQAGAMGVVTITDVAPLPSGAAHIEVALVPTLLPVGTNSLCYCDPAGADGGIDFSYNGSIRCLQVDLTNAASQTESTTYWDLLKTWLLQTRAHVVESWDVASQTAQTYVNGAGCLPLQQLAVGVSTLPPTITPTLNIGTDGAGHFIGAVIEAISIGPTYLDCATVQAMSTAAGVTPSLRVGCMGNSITGFQDGYHVQANTRLGVGNGRAVLANFGLSGNTTDQMLARFDENIYRDSLGGLRNWDSVIIEGGINDAMFHLSSAAHIIANLAEMERRALSWGLKVAFLEIMPCRGRSEWSPAIQAVIDEVNAWINTRRNVARAYQLLQVTTTGTFGGGHAGNTNGTGPGYYGGAAGGGVQNGAGTQTYDELHPTGSGADAASAPIQNTGAQRGSDAIGDLVYSIFPLLSPIVPPTPAPQQSIVRAGNAAYGGGGGGNDGVYTVGIFPYSPYWPYASEDDFEGAILSEARVTPLAEQLMEMYYEAQEKRLREQRAPTYEDVLEAFRRSLKR